MKKIKEFHNYVLKKYNPNIKSTIVVMQRIKEYNDYYSEQIKNEFNIKFSKNESGKTLPRVPWYSFVFNKNDLYEVTILFDINSQNIFMSIQFKTDNYNAEAKNIILKFGRDNIANVNKYISPNKDMFKRKNEKTWERPKNYGKYSIIALDITYMSEEEMFFNIEKFVNYAKTLNSNWHQKNNNEFVAVDEIMAYSKIRKGQKKWKNELIKKYGQVCAICPINELTLLRGSHIVRWADEKKQRGSIYNGFILCVWHDILFELKMISFNEEGHLCVSKKDKNNNYKKMFINNKLQKTYIDNIKMINTNLLKHRKNIKFIKI